MAIEVETIVNGPIMGNGYLVYDTQTNHAVIIDPGDEPEKFSRRISFLLLQPQAILCTHAHIDHCGAVYPLQSMFPKIMTAMHEEEKDVLTYLDQQALMFDLSYVHTPEITNWLKDNEILKFENFEIEVFHTPGHTPGGVSFYIKSENILFSGDTLFAGSVGRTDLPGGSYKALLNSIKTKLLTLPPNTHVFCGHGPKTSIDFEKRTNPFVR